MTGSLSKLGGEIERQRQKMRADMGHHVWSFSHPALVERPKRGHADHTAPRLFLSSYPTIIFLSIRSLTEGARLAAHLVFA